MTSRTPARLHAGTGSALPFSSSGSTGSASTASRRSRYVVSPRSTWPGSACCSRRAATFTASPVTNAFPPPGSPATTSPVLTPMRTWIVTPRSRSSSLFSAASAVAHVRRGARRPERVVLVQHRDAEHRHDRVADVLLDRPAVSLDRGPHRVEVPRLHVPHGLGIELLAQRGRAGHVAEHDGDGLADLAGGGDGGERRRARRTEREVLRALAPTVRAGQHRTERTADGPPGATGRWAAN